MSEAAVASRTGWERELHLQGDGKRGVMGKANWHKYKHTTERKSFPRVIDTYCNGLGHVISLQHNI